MKIGKGRGPLPVVSEPRGSLLFLDQLPEHQGGVGAPDRDDVPVVVEETGAGHLPAVHLLFGVFGFRIRARVSGEKVSRY